MALDNFRTQKIIWDRANKKIFEAIEANAGDSNGRKLVVQVVNQETTESLLGTTLSLGWKSRKGAKGLDAFNLVDASKGIFEIYYTTEMLSNIGNLEASLILIDSTGRIESSAFTISVRPSTVDDESVESENSFTALTEALVKVSDLEDNYAPRLNEVTAQLAQTEKKTETTANVKLFGAIGDGMTDDTQAFIDAIASLPETGGVLYVPTAKYYVPNGGVVVDKPITILGDGAGTYESGGSRILVDSPTAILFRVNKPGTVIVGLTMENISSTRPTDGCAIYSTDFDWCRVERCIFIDFYDGARIDIGYFYSFSKCAFLGIKNYGLYMRNIGGGQFDHGDQIIEGCNFSKYGDTVNGGTCIKWESGGGLRIIGSKVNAGTQPGYTNTGFFDNGFVTEMQEGSTSVHVISGCSIEGWLENGILLYGVAGASFGKISITGNEFLGSGTLGTCIKADGLDMNLNNIVITGNVGYGIGSGGVTLKNLKKAVVVGNNWADCGKGALNLTNVLELVQGNNLWRTSILDFDADVFNSSSAGHNRGAWIVDYDVKDSLTFKAGQWQPGQVTAGILEIEIVGSIAGSGTIYAKIRQGYTRSSGTVGLSGAPSVENAGSSIGNLSVDFDISTKAGYIIPNIITTGALNGKVTVKGHGIFKTINYNN